MNIELSEAPIAAVMELALVPMSFTVDRVYDVAAGNDGAPEFVLSERSIDAPYLKNYDTIPGEGPDQWARQLKIETQNINVAACRFYARQGCVLRAINPFAYPHLPDEVQMLWYKDL